MKPLSSPLIPAGALFFPCDLDLVSRYQPGYCAADRHVTSTDWWSPTRYRWRHHSSWFGNFHYSGKMFAHAHWRHRYLRVEAVNSPKIRRLNKASNQLAKQWMGFLFLFLKFDKIEADEYCTQSLWVLEIYSCRAGHWGFYYVSGILWGELEYAVSFSGQCLSGVFLVKYFHLGLFTCCCIISITGVQIHLLKYSWEAINKLVVACALRRECTSRVWSKNTS